MRFSVMVAVCGLAASAASASLMDSSTTSLSNSSVKWTATSLNSGSTTWTASASTANGRMYASGYELSSGAAMLTTAQVGVSTSGMNEGRRSVVVAVPIPTAGTHSWSLATALSNYDKQYNYWQAYLVKDGATIPLTGGPNWGAAPSGTSLLAKDYAPKAMSDGTFHDYSLSFSVTDKQVKQGYQYVALVMTGSRQESQMLGWRGVTTNMPTAAAFGSSVPEPATMGLLAVGGLLMTRRRAGLWA